MNTAPVKNVSYRRTAFSLPGVSSDMRASPACPRTTAPAIGSDFGLLFPALGVSTDAFENGAHEASSDAAFTEISQVPLDRVSRALITVLSCNAPEEPCTIRSRFWYWRRFKRLQELVLNHRVGAPSLCVNRVVRNEAGLLGLLRCIDTFDTCDCGIRSLDNCGNKPGLEGGGCGQRKFHGAVLQTQASRSFH